MLSSPIEGCAMLRTARPEDCTAVEAIVIAAYSMYVERIGKAPGPMLDDYAGLIAAGAVSVLEDPDGAIAATHRSIKSGWRYLPGCLGHGGKRRSGRAKPGRSARSEHRPSGWWLR